MMADMTNPRTFEIELVDRTIIGTMHMPELQVEEPDMPAALICHSPKLSEEESLLVDALVESLVGSGIAVVVYLTQRNNDSLIPTEHDAVDDASAAFRWLALHENIDLHRLFLIGYAQGAVPASCLARRTDQLAGLCLLTPTPVFNTTKSNGNGAKQTLTTEKDPLTPIKDAAYFDRPTLIIFAGSDKVIPFAESCIYLNALEAIDHMVEHLIIARADHAFCDETARRLCLDKITRFFENSPAVMSAEISQ